jgi:predicted DNA binding CopG/RHH family protein
MKKKTIKYTNEPIGKVKVVKDFLPPPSDLVLREETIKVTLSLTKESVDFFKAEAKRHQTQYQKMIRTLLDQYAQLYKERS